MLRWRSATSWVLNLGLGADSCAMLLRLLAEPDLRPLPLDRLVVVVAMTGSEWDLTAQLVTRHILPALAEHGVRTVQVARAGRLQGAGVEVLDDSPAPAVLHVDGAFTLLEYLTAAGTVPQVGGRRLCSVNCTWCGRLEGAGGAGGAVCGGRRGSGESSSGRVGGRA